MQNQQNLPVVIVGKPTREVVVEFFTALWIGLNDEFILNIWTKQDKRTYSFAFPSDINACAAQVEHLARHNRDVYFGIGLQADRPEPGKRGGEAGVAAISCLWFDLDVAGAGHAQTALPPTRQDAFNLINALPLKPGIIIETGGGLQAYWLLDRPLLIQTEEDRQHVKSLSTRFQKFVTEQGRSHGWKFDATQNLDRLLRVPGAFNYKLPTTPRPVRILYMNPDLRYSAAEIEAITPATPSKSVAKNAPTAKLGAKSRVQNQRHPSSDPNKVRASCPFVEDCIANAITLPEPAWYALLSIICRCENGRELCHEYSSPYLNYSFTETERKIDQALNNARPRTCENIRFNCGGEEFCSVCPHWGRVRSPITLGCDPAELKRFNGARLLDLLPGAPASDMMDVPYGYRVSFENGVEQLQFDKDGNECGATTCCPVPIFVSKRLKQCEDGKERTVASFFMDGGWQDISVERRTIADYYEVIKLANYGLPITRPEGGLLTRYMQDFCLQNQGVIPLVETYGTMGYVRRGEAFLWGKNMIKPTGSTLEVQFESADNQGAEQLADGFVSGGDESEWFAMANELYAYPKAAGMLYAALVPPMLDILGAQNFLFDVAGRTSKGKTIALKIAASAWGDPEILAFNWDNTAIFVEQLASSLNGLPMFLDDTKLSGSGKLRQYAGSKVAHVIYQVSGGKGRGRGAKKGTRRTATWRIILLITGEQSAVDFTTEDGGTHARVLGLSGLPFERSDIPHVVNKFKGTAQRNYGFAGPRFVQWLLDHKEDEPLWRAAYQELIEHYTAKAGNNSVASRLGEHFATLHITMLLGHAALPEFKPATPIGNIIDDLWECVIAGADEADRTAAAIRDLYEWAVANQHRFWGRGRIDNDGNVVAPNSGWAGAWEPNTDWTTLDITQATLESVLGFKYEIKGVFKDCGQRGWLKRSGKNLQREITINGEKTRVFSLVREKLISELGIANLVDEEDDA